MPTTFPWFLLGLAATYYLAAWVSGPNLTADDLREEQPYTGYTETTP